MSVGDANLGRLGMAVRVGCPGAAGGCDGAKPGRNYYTELARQVPADCVILTLACGKYRFNNLPFGDIGGIPRLLDCGQCNDAYSAIQIAAALAKPLLLTLNHAPDDGTDLTWNALRLVGQLKKDGAEVRLFLMNDSVDLARDGMTVPEGSLDLVRMTKDLIARLGV